MQITTLFLSLKSDKERPWSCENIREKELISVVDEDGGVKAQKKLAVNQLRGIAYY